jgi:hypothetical protein
LLRGNGKLLKIRGFSKSNTGKLLKIWVFKKYHRVFPLNWREFFFPPQRKASSIIGRKEASYNSGFKERPLRLPLIASCFRAAPLNHMNQGYCTTYSLDGCSRAAPTNNSN